MDKGLLQADVQGDMKALALKDILGMLFAASGCGKESKQAIKSCLYLGFAVKSRVY